MSAVMHQRTVPASKAPPVATRAPSSVFGLASTLAAPQPASQEQSRPAEPPPAKISRKPSTDPSRGEQTIALLRQRGPMTSTAVAASLGIDGERASVLLCSLKRRGVGVVGKDGRRKLYGMAAAAASPPAAAPDGAATVPSTPAVAGFKRWLDQNGDASAEGRQVPRKRAKPAAECTVPTSTSAIPAVPRSVSAPTAAEPSSFPEPELVCGLFNNGDLVIEVGTNRLRLKQRHTRELVAYLERIGDAALEFEHPGP